MRRGTKPKPAAVKRREGNPGKRPIPEEPAYPVGWPVMPSWLDKTGREVWRYTAKQMQDAGVVRLVDRDLLAAYCDAVSRAIKASRKSRRGDEQHRWQARAEKAWDSARKLAALFGIGPAEASQVRDLSPPDSVDPVEEFTERRRRMRVVNDG